MISRACHQYLFSKFLIFFGPTYLILAFKFAWTPLKGKKKLFRLLASWYSKWPAWAHRFNSKIGFEKYIPSPEILAKMSQNMKVWFGDLNLVTFWSISQDSMQIFQTRFLHWNCELKPVILSTMNPLNGTNFFLPY